jgi:hypothetical protein
VSPGSPAAEAGLEARFSMLLQDSFGGDDMTQLMASDLQIRGHGLEM